MAKKKHFRLFSIFTGCLMAVSQVLPAVTPTVYAEENKAVLSVNVQGEGDLTVTDGSNTYVAYESEPVKASFKADTELTFTASDGKEVESISEDGNDVTNDYKITDNKTFNYTTRVKDTTLDVKLKAKDEGVVSKPSSDATLTTPSNMTEEQMEEAKNSTTTPISDSDKAMILEYEKGNYNNDGYVQTRLKRGKKLGLDKYQDEDGFLTYDYFASKDFTTQKSGIEILIKWESDGSYTIKAKKSTLKKSIASVQSLDGGAWVIDSVKLFTFAASGGNINNGEFILRNTTTGQKVTGLCGDGWAAVPRVGQTMGDPMTAEAAIAEHAQAKAKYPSEIWASGNVTWLKYSAYYGYGGPGYQTWKNALTSHYNTANHPEWTNDNYLGIISSAISSDALGNYTSNPEMIYVSGAFTSYNQARTTAWNLMMNLPAPPADFECYVFPNTETAPAAEGHYFQAHTRQPAVVGYYNPTGNLKIQKASSNASITDDNGCYASMEGVQYGLYSDAGAKTQVGTFTLKKDGTSNTIEGLKHGTYYIKEIKQPEGYEKDDTIYSVEVLSGKTVTKSFTDKPITTTVDLQKQDALTGSNTPQGDASFKDAQYKVIYYDTVLNDNSDPAKSNKKAKRSWIMKTDTNGKIVMNDDYKISGDDLYKDNGNFVMPLGTYTIQEIKAPTGYKINSEVKVIKVTADNPTVETQISKETPYLGKFSLHKSITDADSSADIRDEAGAEFTAVAKKYYTEAGNDFDKAFALAKEKGTKYEWAVVTTDDHGDCTSSDLVYGEYVLKQTKLGETEVKEFDDIFYFVVSNKGDNDYTYGKLKDGRELTPSSDGLVHYYINNIPVTASLKIAKKDKTTGEVVSLNGATFQIKMYGKDGKVEKNYSKKTIRTDENGVVSVKVGTKWYNSFRTNSDNTVSVLGKIAEKISNSGQYTAVSDEDKGSVTVPVQLPVGDYELCEIKAPTGYLLDTTPQKFRISKSTVTGKDEDGQLYLMSPITDDVPYGEVTLKKKFDGKDFKHGEVKFNLIVDSDIINPATGKYMYHKGDIYGTYKLDKNNEIVVKKLPLGVDGNAKYKFVEASTYENYELDQTEYGFEFTKKDDTTPTYSQTVEVENHPIEIHTTATNAFVENSHEFNSAWNVKLIDKVSYSGVIVGKQLTMKGVLIDKATGKEVIDSVTGKPVTGVQRFTPTSKSGTVEVTMDFCAYNNGLAGKDYVVYETLLNSGLEGHENCEIATHKDLNDKNQTITILDSKIHTTFKSENGTHEQQINKNNKYSLTDTVKYEGLVKGQTYIMTGTLMDKATEKPLTDKDGKKIVVEKEFVPNESGGTVDLTFEFEKDDFKANQTIVAYEQLYEKDPGLDRNVVAEHKDINDEGQSISLIDVHTTATSGNKTHEQGVSKDIVTIKDRVAYEGLKVGKEYTINGTLVDKKTGKPIVARMAEVETTSDSKKEDSDKDNSEGSDVKDNESTSDSESKDDVKNDSNKDENTTSDENSTPSTKITYKLKDKAEEVKSSVTFTPKTSDGYVDIYFAFDGSVLYGGEEVVAFESLTRKGIEVATHADIEDNDQTVTIVQIHTTATINDKKKTYSEGTVKVKDTVSYKGLHEGQTYELTGTLMNKKTGKAFEIDGKKVTSKVKFKADKSEGTVDVFFEFDASKLGDVTLVVFEDLTNVDTNTKITDHKDINDKDQTIELEKKPETGVRDTNNTTYLFSIAGVLGILIVLVLIAKRRIKE